LIQRYHLEQLDQYEYVVASYADQQLLLRAATANYHIIRPRLLTSNEVLELLTFKSPGTLDGLVYQSLKLDPGFTPTINELLRAPNLAQIELPHNVKGFYDELIERYHVQPRVYISPAAKIGIFGPIDRLLASYLVNYDCEEIYLQGLDATLTYTNFDTQYDEVVSIMEEVAKELDLKGFGSLGLVCADASYHPYLSMIAQRHHIPLEFQSSQPAINHPMVARLFHDFLTNPTWEYWLEVLNRLLIGESEVLESIHRQLLRWSSDYQALALTSDELIVMVEHVLKKTMYRSPRAKNVIKVYSSFNQTIEEPRLFILGVNQGVYPPVYSTTKLISEQDRERLGLDRSADKNKHATDSFVHHILLREQVWLTAKSRTTSQFYATTSLLHHPELKDLIRVQKPKFDRTVRTSRLQDIITYKKMRFQQQRQGFYTDDLEYLHYHYESQLPAEYSNKFNGIDPQTLEEYPTPNVASYSSLNSFFHCQFRYWMNHVLVVDEFEESLALHIGNMTHYIVKQLGYHYGGREFAEKIKDYAEEYIGEIKPRLNASDLFFLYHVVPHITRAVELLQQFQEHSRFELQFLEQKITLPLKKSLMTLQGVIDHVSIHEDSLGTDKVLLVDYKTGNPYPDFRKVEYGLDSQLFIYMLLIREGDLLENPVFTGAFNFGMIPSNVPGRHPKKSYQDLLDESYQFNGYVTNNMSDIEVMYDFYRDDKLFRLNIKKDGTFGSKATTYDNEYLMKLLDYLLAKIEVAGFEIKAGQFDINPKYFGDYKPHSSFFNSSCKYCNIRDICYRKEGDFVSNKIHKNETFGELLERLSNWQDEEK